MNQHDTVEGKIGSKGFRAPEVIKELPHDLKIDVWGYGCLLFGILFVRLPFSDEKDAISDERFYIWS